MSNPVIPTPTLHDRFAIALRHANITQETLAARLGLTSRTVRSWMATSPRVPSPDQFDQAARVLGVDLEWLKTGRTR